MKAATPSGPADALECGGASLALWFCGDLYSLPSYTAPEGTALWITGVVVGVAGLTAGRAGLRSALGASQYLLPVMGVISACIGALLCAWRLIATTLS
jgi:hypothetical protein